MSDNPDSVVVPRGQYDLASRSAELLSKMLGDPRTAARAEELVSQINPDAKFPQRDMRNAILQPVEARLEAERARVEALETRLNTRDAADAEARTQRDQDAMMTRINTVKAKRGFSDEAMEKVIQRMRDNNNPDVEAAAAWVADSMPKPGPATGHDYLGGNVDVFGSQSESDQWKGLTANPDKWLTNELRTIARDPDFARMGQG